MRFSVPRRVLSSAALVGVLLTGAAVALPQTEHALARGIAEVALPTVSRAAAPTDAKLVDSLAPRRALTRPARDAPPSSDADDAAARAAGFRAAWPRAHPARDYQYSRTAKERGVQPCEAQDPGFGVHAAWVHVRPMGQFIAPRGSAFISADGGFDLVVHFHGHRPARKEFVRSGEDLVLLGVSLGIGAAYGPPFADPKHFETLVSGVERALSRREARAVHVRRIALSSWSRGYEAIAEILTQPIAEKVRALILLDSLHASREPAPGRLALEPFARFAERAARGETFFLVSHSSIDPPDYASTTETARYLVAALGGVPTPALRKDPLGLELFEIYEKGRFYERGYTGNGKLDHCAHFGVYAEAVQGLSRFFRGAPTRK
ncbi:MAG: hypothetical protein KC776_11915 [Myxococcales bacterium]|nr:hypothetical protein [Myxococcales bacterium]